MSDMVARQILNGFGFKVVRILPVENAKIEKCDDGFQVSVLYELEDGSKVKHHIWKSRKRDVKTELDILPHEPYSNMLVTVCNGCVNDECFW